ncbi:MAG TPA: MYXO-CTERM sorting domain-containing protein, partial [Kofleriaceae bacterium]|nr:MYXO-CTERM sorting domain-containing protein [Kofleriaceae bacterium]
DAQFVVDGQPTAPIAPGQSASFTVTFAPTLEATTSSTIAITLAGSTTPELVVTVTGEGAVREDTSGCSSTRSGSPWLALVVVAVWRRRRSARR